MKQITTLEEAVQICEENLLNVQFELDFEKKEKGESNCRVVIVSESPFKGYKAENLILAVNEYLKAVEDKRKALKVDNRSAEEVYNDNLRCTNCGEDDKSNLAFQNDFADSEEWLCKGCGDKFQIPHLKEE